MLVSVTNASFALVKSINVKVYAHKIRSALAMRMLNHCLTFQPPYDHFLILTCGYQLFVYLIENLIWLLAVPFRLA